MERKIKLAVCINDFRIGGAQKLVVEVLSRIDFSIFDIHLITFVQYSDTDSFYEDIPTHVKVHKISFKGFKDLRSWITTYKLLKEIKPDVVWTSLFFSNTVIRLLKLFCRFRVISTEQNTYLKRSALQKNVDWLLAFVTYRIVVVSNFLLEFVSKQEGIRKDKFTVIHNAVNTKKIASACSVIDITSVKKELGISADTRVIINIGQLINQKNQELLINAFEKFSERYPDYILVILGDGALREKLSNQVATLGLDEKVRLMGIQKDVPKFLAAADFFVLSSRFEGFPLVVIEALASGLPIVSTPVSGSDEYLFEGKNGFLVQPHVESIAAGMSKMAGLKTTEKIAFTQQSKELAESFDIVRIGNKYQALFIEAANS